MWPFNGLARSGFLLKPSYMTEPTSISQAPVRFLFHKIQTNSQG